MQRSTVAAALLPVLLIQLSLPAAAAGSPARPRGDTQPTLDKESTRPRTTPLDRATDKGSTRPRSGPIDRGYDKEPTRPSGRPVDRQDEPAPEGDRVHRFRYRAPNDFLVDVRAWPAEAGGFTVSAALVSRSGERMTFDLSPDAGFGPTVLIDGYLVVGYRIARDGRVRGLTVHDGEREVTSFRGLGGSADADAYLHLVDSVTAHHSPEFLEEMTVAMRSLREDAVAPANLREILECTLGVTGYVLSVWGVLTGCTVLGVPTLGASCIFAILAHEVAIASAILSCLPD